MISFSNKAIFLEPDYLINTQYPLSEPFIIVKLREGEKLMTNIYYGKIKKLY